MAKRVIVLQKLGDRSWQLAYWLNVPAARVAFYASPGKASVWSGASTQENAEIAAGRVTETLESLSYEGTKTLAEVEALAEARWASLQAEVNAFNPWQRTGTYWDGTTWTLGGVS